LACNWQDLIGVGLVVLGVEEPVQF